MEKHGQPGTSMDKHGKMEKQGQTGTKKDKHEQKKTNMNKQGQTGTNLKNMNTHGIGHTLSSMGKHRQIWTNMDPSPKIPEHGQKLTL